MKVTNLLALHSKFIPVDCSAKMYMDPLNMLVLPAVTETLSVNGSGEKSQEENGFLAGPGLLKYVWSSPEPCFCSTHGLGPTLCSGQKHPAASCFLLHSTPLKWFCSRLPSLTGYLGGQVGDCHI